MTECPTTGELSAFQVEHGRSCRLPFDSQFVEAAQVLDERKMIGVYGQLAAASALYRKVAAEAADAARTASSERLNRAGGSGREVKFQVGEIVVTYLPQLRRKEKATNHPHNGKQNICSNGGAHAQWKLCWGDLLTR